MPLGANVPRRRPAADASSLILPPRTFAPASHLRGGPQAKAGRRAGPGPPPRQEQELAAEAAPTTAKAMHAIYGHGRPSPRVPLDHRSQRRAARSEEHTSELQSLMRISYAVF